MFTLNFISGKGAKLTIRDSYGVTDAPHGIPRVTVWNGKKPVGLFRFMRSTGKWDVASELQEQDNERIRELLAEQWRVSA